VILVIEEEIIKISVMIAGILMSASYFPQAYKMMKRKSSADISLISYLMLLPAVALWVFYGFYINDYPVAVSSIFGFIGTVLIVALWFAYKK
jgi:MtN3 and saliva related transmembrane protein